MEYNYVTLQCRLSDYDRRTPVDDFKPIELTDAQGIDYFENLCLEAENSCADERTFSSPRIGVPDQKIALHVNVQFYTDKELMVRMALTVQLSSHSNFRPTAPPRARELVRLSPSSSVGRICIWAPLGARDTTAVCTTWTTGPFLTAPPPSCSMTDL